MRLENSASFMPKYKQIQTNLIQQIQVGTLKPGDKIPSEADLAQTYGVSRVTANTAIRELTTMGIIDRIQGVGSFVKEIPTESDSMCFGAQTKFSLREGGCGNKNHTCLSIAMVGFDRHLQSIFDLSADTRFLRIVRQVSSNTIPEELDYSFVPESFMLENNINPAELTMEYFSKRTNLYLHDWLSSISKHPGKYVRIYFRTQVDCSFGPEAEKILDSDSVLIWDTVVFNEHNAPIGVTTTISTQAVNSPFLTFEL